MAFLIACADGNITTSSTWRTIAANPVAPEGLNTANSLTTSYTTSSNFAPGAVEVDAIALKFFVPGAAGQTVTVSLYDVTSSSEVVAVAIPTADINPGTNGNGSRAGWQLFSLGANYTLEAGKNYAIRIKHSAAGQATTVAYSSGVTNWFHMLRTTTNAAPSTGDSLMILGLWTSSGTWTQYTVTVDTTSTSPTFGATPSGTYWEERNQGIYISRSTLTWPTTSSTTISITGGLRIHAYGKATCGTTASPIVRGTEAVIYMVSGTGNNINLQNLGTFSLVGQSPHSSCSVNHATLVNTATSGSTASLLMSTSTYWTSGSRVVIQSARYNEYDKQQVTTVSADATTESLTLAAAVTNNFPGSSGTYCGSELFLASYNARIDVSTTAFAPYCTPWANSTLQVEWAGMGQTAWEWNPLTSCSIYANKCGWYFAGATGNGTSAFRFNGAATTTSVYLCDLWTNNPSGGSSGWNFYLSFTGTAPANAWYCDGLFGANRASNGGIYVSHGKHWSVLRNLKTLCGAGMISGTSNESAGWKPVASDYMADAVCIGSANGGQIVVPEHIRDHTYSRWVAVSAFHILQFNYAIFNVTLQDGIFLTSTNYNIVSDGANMRLRNIVFSSCSIGGYGSTTPLVVWPINASYSGLLDMKFLGCRGNSSYSTASTGSFLTLSGVGDSHSPVEMRVVVNPDFGNWNAASVVALTGNAAYFNKESFVSFRNFKGVYGDHRIYKPRLPDGTTAALAPRIQTNTTVYNTAAPSEEVIPLTTASKLESSVKRFAVTSGSTASVGVYVYKSAAYNGAQPRLIIRRNDSAGYTDDTVGATMTTGTGAWENLTTTIAAAPEDVVLEVVVDCDGTTGSIYVDDWSAT